MVGTCFLVSFAQVSVSKLSNMASAEEMKDLEDKRLAKTEAKPLINDEFDKTLVGVKGAALVCV